MTHEALDILALSIRTGRRAFHVFPHNEKDRLQLHRERAMAQEAAQSILTAQVRVDEAALRKRSGDWLATLMERIAEASGA